MRVSRFLPIVAAGALVAATVTPAAAQDEPEGIGSTTGALTALGLDVAGLLNLELLSDNGAATTDPIAGVPAARAALTALSLEQPTTGLDQDLSVFEVQSTGAPDTAGHDGATPIDNPVVSGNILPTLLDAAVGADGPVAGVTSGIGNLSVLGGVLNLQSTASDLGSAVLPTSADGQRALEIDALTILDLESLLAGLGIPLTGLPTDTVLGLVESLGITQLDPILDQLDAALAQLQPLLDSLGLGDFALDDLTDLAELPAVIDDLTGGLDLLQGVTGGTGSVTQPVCTLVGGLLGSVLDCSNPTAVVTGAVSQVSALAGPLADLQALVDQLLPGLLDSALDLLQGTALLSLEGLDVSVLTKATDDVATSVADVTATLGAINVGQTSIPVGDLLGAGNQLSAVLGQVQGLVDGVLNTVGVGLEDLIDIGLLEEQTSVTEGTDGSVTSKAVFNGLRVDVLPIVGELQGVLDGILGGLGGAGSIGDTLEGLGLPVPDPLALVPVEALGGDLGLPALDGLLNGTAALELLDGLSLRTATLEQESTYVLSATATPTTPGTPGAPAAPTGGPSLPRTGGDAGMLLLAAIAAVGALGVRRWMVSRTD